MSPAAFLSHGTRVRIPVPVPTFERGDLSVAKALQGTAAVPLLRTLGELRHVAGKGRAPLKDRGR
jgi:hypothetical protein